jgi:hypothetical protein
MGIDMISPSSAAGSAPRTTVDPRDVSMTPGSMRARAEVAETTIEDHDLQEQAAKGGHHVLVHFAGLATRGHIRGFAA